MPDHDPVVVEQRQGEGRSHAELPGVGLRGAPDCQIGLVYAFLDGKQWGMLVGA